jgi:hypothetical protein
VNEEQWCERRLGGALHGLDERHCGVVAVM